jgi:hypothetical protein
MQSKGIKGASENGAKLYSKNRAKKQVKKTLDIKIIRKETY